MLKTEEFETFAYVFGQTPSPCGYSLLAKRESVFFTPPLEEEVDSIASAVEDGGVLFFVVFGNSGVVI